MNLNFFAGAEYKNKIYFSAYHVNGLFVMDLENEEITFLKIFDKEKMKARLHRVAFIHNNEIWFIPQEAENIACVNLDTLNIVYYKPLYTNTNIDFDTSTNYHLYLSGRVVNDRYLYLVPADIDTVSVIDMETHEINSVYMIEDIEKERYNDLIVIDGMLWMLPRIGVGLRVIDLDTKEIIEKKWGYEDYSYSSVEVANGKLWFAPSVARNILSVDMGTGKHNLLEFDTHTNKYSGILLIDNILIMCPIEGENFVIVDSYTSKSWIEEYIEHKHIFTKNPNKVSIIASNENKIITTGVTNCIVQFNGYKITKSISIKGNLSNFSIFRDEFSKYVFAGGTMINNFNLLDEIIGLESYLSNVVRISNIDKIKEGSIGEDIWKNISK